MCYYKTLKNNQYGYVLQCNKCGHIRIAFGTSLISVSLPDFRRMIEAAIGLHAVYEFHPSGGQKIIQMDTPVPQVAIVFTIWELKTFLHLLVESDKKISNHKKFTFSEN